MLNASPAFALPVAEAALGMAIDLARGITAADRAMRAGTEVYGARRQRGSFLLRGAPVGLIGFGDLGRALRRLLVPFRCPVLVHDPWLPDQLLREPADSRRARRPAGDRARDLRVRRGHQRIEGFLGRAQLELIRRARSFC